MNLALNDAERELLLRVLDDELARLKSEIYRTDTWEYKEQLKSREDLLVGMIDRLRDAEGSEAG